MLFSALDTARSQLAFADDPTAYAALGNVCRGAIIALADELYQSLMLPEAAAAPHGDDAAAKLRYVAHFYASGQSSRQNEGLDKFIDATWKLAVEVFLVPPPKSKTLNS